MRDKDKIVISKIISYAQTVVKYSAQYDELEDFKADTMCVDAYVFNLMQIGELAKTAVSIGTKESIRTIPWNQLYGMRNRIVHEYEGVDLNIVWSTIKEDLPRLINAFEATLKETG